MNWLFTSFFLPSFPLIKHHPINFRFEDISDDSHSFTGCEYYSTGTSRHGSYKKTIIDIDWQIEMSQHIIHKPKKTKRTENILFFETKKKIQEIH